MSIILKNKKDCIKGVAEGAFSPENQLKRCKTPALTLDHFPNTKLD